MLAEVVGRQGREGREKRVYPNQVNLVNNIAPSVCVILV